MTPHLTLARQGLYQGSLIKLKLGWGQGHRKTAVFPERKSVSPSLVPFTIPSLHPLSTYLKNSNKTQASHPTILTTASLAKGLM